MFVNGTLVEYRYFYYISTTLVDYFLPFIDCCLYHNEYYYGSVIVLYSPRTVFDIMTQRERHVVQILQKCIKHHYVLL